jgi:hypothetical protein
MIVSRIALVVGGIGGVVAAFALFSLVNILWLLPAARDEGRELERADALKKSIELIQKRSETNAEIRNLSARDLCVALDGEFVDGVCQ